MLVHTMTVEETNEAPVDMKALQAPLREAYLKDVSAALVTDHARSHSSKVPATDPLYGQIAFADPNNTTLDIALHKGVGGRSDLPVPGDILCAAIASCLDSTMRVVANFLGVEFETLEVAVDADVDLRGTLRMDQTVPVAFQDIRVAVTMTPQGDVPEATLNVILAAAEQSCVVLQTLKTPPAISVERNG